MSGCEPCRLVLCIILSAVSALPWLTTSLFLFFFRHSLRDRVARLPLKNPTRYAFSAVRYLTASVYVCQCSNVSAFWLVLRQHNEFQLGYPAYGCSPRRTHKTLSLTTLRTDCRVFTRRFTNSNQMRFNVPGHVGFTAYSLLKHLCCSSSRRAHGGSDRAHSGENARSGSIRNSMLLG